MRCGLHAELTVMGLCLWVQVFSIFNLKKRESSNCKEKYFFLAPLLQAETSEVSKKLRPGMSIKHANMGNISLDASQKGNQVASRSWRQRKQQMEVSERGITLWKSYQARRIYTSLVRFGNISHSVSNHAGKFPLRGFTQWWSSWRSM